MVSLIIPAYNAENTIGKCLDSFFSNNFDEEIEVIVIDDGSTDSTAYIVTGYRNVHLIRQKNAGPSSARNRGADEAKGDIILFTDSDCEPFPDWFAEMMSPFKKNDEVIGVKGAYKTKQKELIARFVQLEYEDKYDKMKKEEYIFLTFLGRK